MTGVWSGAAGTVWTAPLPAFTGGNSFATSASTTDPVTSLYFANTDGLLNPVVNTSLVVSTGRDFRRSGGCRAAPAYSVESAGRPASTGPRS
ncbi:MAG: hypothetical protein U1F77_13705 [Kiritimatiellia bacterium]